jgi:hypothetical protein
MASPNKLPAPSVDPKSGCLTDPKTGQPAPVADMRAEFERLSRQVPRNAEAERAFIINKIEMVRGDPNLSEADKELAIEQLRRRL